MTKISSTPVKVAVLCGGGSFERGISLNSARSVLDHLSASDVEIIPIYFDTQLQAWELSQQQLYSNTPSDFDFKLTKTSQPLNQSQLDARLKGVDIVFPAIHGKYGEDGQLQEYLETLGVQFIGSGSRACKQAFDKYESSQFLDRHGYYTIPALLLEEGDQTNGAKTADFFAEHELERAIVKPARAGSSIGVFSVDSVKAAINAAGHILSQGIDSRVVVEPFIDGVEFTVMILAGQDGEPVALIPTEVQIDYSKHQIFDYRKKYLPTRQVTWHSPPRFDDSIIEQIQRKAEQLFRHFAMRDVARFDGWLTNDGEILFADFNPVSGMEQNSFLFLQAAQVGMSHADTLRYLLRLGCNRTRITLDPAVPWETSQSQEDVQVLFGGGTAERQVSVMSGTNVWLKLRRSSTYNPHPYLLDVDERTVWSVPYSMTLHHTVEEISEACRSAKEREPRMKPFRDRIIRSLGLSHAERTETQALPKQMTLDEFINSASLVFVGLHGGIGENGELAQRFDDAGVAYTGSRPKPSGIMMDKYETSQLLSTLSDERIHLVEKIKKEMTELDDMGTSELMRLWQELTEELRCHTMIAKPIGDGCSAGVVRLYSAKDLGNYINLTLEGVPRIPPGTLHRQKNIVEMPTVRPEAILFERFIETDDVLIVENEMFWTPKTRWIEITVGVLGAEGAVKALNPSITVASGEVLSVEEKFQGGTGVNITPPPEEQLSAAIVRRIRQHIEQVAKKLAINGYARIDCFANTHDGDLMIIEANNLPGLTPSTVIYHQALAEDPPMFPTEFLEKILEYRITPGEE